MVAVLNDLFGIQSRGGCSCAGPYGHRLLGIDLERVARVRGARSPAAARASSRAGCGSTSTTSLATRSFDYIVEAVRLVARDGWRLLGDYRFDPASGLWQHRDGPAEPPLRLSDVTYDVTGAMTYPRHDTSADVEVLAGYLAEARAIIDATTPPDCSHSAHLTDDFDALRWFELPEGSLTPSPSPTS